MKANSHTPKTTKVRKDFVAATENFRATYNNADPIGLAELYTENSQLLPPNCEIIEGRKEVQAFWQDKLVKGIKIVSSGTGEVEIHGNTAIEVGKFTVQDEGGRVLDKLKYILIWKQEEGQWKIHRDIWNTCMPKPGQ